MSHTIDAIYESGVFKPLGPVGLSEGQSVRLTIMPVPTAAGDEKQVRDALQSAGLLRPLSPHLQQKIIPGVTLEQVRESLHRAGGKPLSEIIIEQRGPRM